MALKPYSKKSFVKSGDTTLATYSYIEALTGKGVMALYLHNGVNNVTYYWDLVVTPQHSTINSTAALTNGFDYDFDITIGAPLIVEGQPRLDFTYQDHGGATSGTCTLTTKIYHVRGATETEISAGQVNSSSSTGAWATYRINNHMSTITKTTFIKGDKIRLNFTGVVTGTLTFRINTDPLSMGATDNASILYLPVNIQQ